MTKTWTQSPAAFQRFLSWLDQGVESDGQRYVEVRRRLVGYFARKRCRAPDDLADETLTRVARKLEEHGSIMDGPPARYCYVVARFVFLEYLRSADRRHTSLDDDATAGERAAAPVGTANDDEVLARLDECLQTLSDRDQTLIREYYAGTDTERIARRRALAARLELTLNALSIRACRIRDTLEACVASRTERSEMLRTNSSYRKG
ncbi:MAG TPA: sigma-70 family RNA polymerase sigma factor [Vicinamibacterales bacterium]